MLLLLTLLLTYHTVSSYANSDDDNAFNTWKNWKYGHDNMVVMPTNKHSTARSLLSSTNNQTNNPTTTPTINPTVYFTTSQPSRSPLPNGQTHAPTCNIINTVGINTISCGETKTGNHQQYENTAFVYTATSKQAQVYLEGCQSTHDIYLQIQNACYQTIEDEDDQFHHGSQVFCGHEYAGDITIPDSVSINDQYIFIVRSPYVGGYYSVTLYCETSCAINTAATISCGETRSGYRSSQQRIEYLYTVNSESDVIYLEGCNSDHDLLLEIKNSCNQIIEREDTSNAHGYDESLCGHQYANDITMPVNVTVGEKYLFIIDGYDVDEYGNYQVTLYCEAATISCGETRSGYRSPQQRIEYLYTVNFEYDIIYLEGCNSDHDLLLEIRDVYNYLVASDDSSNNHGDDQSQCGHLYANDITMPGAVTIGEQYIFIIDGYDDNEYGNYQVTLFCVTDPTKSPTNIPPSPSLSISPTIGIRRESGYKYLYYDPLNTLSNWIQQTTDHDTVFTVSS